MLTYTPISHEPQMVNRLRKFVASCPIELLKALLDCFFPPNEEIGMVDVDANEFNLVEGWL